MKIAVLSTVDSWYFKDLCRAAAGRHEVQCVGFSRMHAWLGGDHRIFSGEVELSAVDAVLVRTMPPGSLEQVVFRMDALARLAEAGVVVCNPPRAIEIAVDKYLSTVKLQAAGIRVPRTAVCQTHEDALAAWESLGGSVVVKPLFGGEGRGIMRVEDGALAERVFKTLEQIGAVIYLQEFIPHNGHDLRVLLIGDRVLGVKRSNAKDWRTNISLGATAEPFEPDDELVEMARKASASVAAPIAGVDILPGRDGNLYVLEVNAVPGWRATAKVLDVDVAALMLEYVRDEVAQRKLSVAEIDNFGVYN